MSHKITCVLILLYYFFHLSLNQDNSNLMFLYALTIPEFHLMNQVPLITSEKWHRKCVTSSTNLLVTFRRTHFSLHKNWIEMLETRKPSLEKTFFSLLFIEKSPRFFFFSFSCSQVFFFFDGKFVDIKYFKYWSWYLWQISRYKPRRTLKCRKMVPRTFWIWGIKLLFWVHLLEVYHWVAQT